MDNNRDLYFLQEEIWFDEPLTYQKEVLSDILANIPSDVRKILDVGCGNGFITNRLSKEKYEVVGFDKSTTALKKVIHQTVQGDVTSLPFPDKSFDLVMINDVIEHLAEEEMAQALAECCRVAKKYILVTVPFLEDLNSGTSQCAECLQFFHVNHHLRSFDLESTRRLLKSDDYTCYKQILSGDVWQADPGQIVFFKRLMLMDMPTGISTVCPNCGGKKTVTQHRETEEILNTFLTSIPYHSTTYTNPTHVRSECISIFARKDVSYPEVVTPHSSGFLNNKWQSTELPFEEKYVHVLDLRNEMLHRKKHIPVTSLLPYYVSSCSAGENGVEVSEENSLLVGFFGNLRSSNSKIILSGYCEQESVITVSPYDNIEAYYSPINAIVLGSFTVSLDFNNLKETKYGFLFNISCSRKCFLQTIELADLRPDRVRIFDNSNQEARYYKIAGHYPVYLSLDLYGKYVFHHDWMDSISKLSPYFGPSLINNPYRAIQTYFIDGLESIVEKTKRNFEYQLSSRNHKISELEDMISLQGQKIRKVDEEKKLLHNQYLTEKKSLILEYQNKINVLTEEKEKITESLNNYRSKYYLSEMKCNNLKHQYEKSLIFKGKKAIKKIVSVFARGNYQSFEEYMKTIYKYSEASVQFSDHKMEKKSFLMICHDQHIDRRIMQQAKALIDEGWTGKIIALSFNSEDLLDEYDGIPVHRIGLSRIVPNCPVYLKYQNRQRQILTFGRGYSLLSKVNWKLYKLQLLQTYKNRSIYYPLPFDRAFNCAAALYPSSLVIAHDLPALRAASMVAEQWNAKLVYDAHELYSEQKVFADLQKRIMDQEEDEFAKRCNKIITVSESFAEVMAMKNGISMPSVILNVTNGIELDIDQKPRLFHHKLNLNSDAKIVLYQGGIANNRNIEALVKGFTLINEANIHLVLLGPSDASLEKKLKKYAGRTLNKQIHFMAAVPQHELLNYTASADIGVIPYPPCDLNTQYCMPNKMFEYIQAGLPILANDLVEVNKVFSSIGGGGLITKLDKPEHFAAGIRLMLTRDLENDRQCLLQSKKQFSWDYEKTKYLKIINEVTGW